jgi:hypothetical protein
MGDKFRQALAQKAKNGLNEKVLSPTADGGGLIKKYAFLSKAIGNLNKNNPKQV